MKICFIISSLKQGGPTGMLANLIRHLDSNQFEISVIALYPNQNADPFFASLDSVYVLKSGNRLVQVQKIIDVLNPDIVHSHGGRADWINARLSGNHCSFSTIHSVIHEDFQMKSGKILGWIKSYYFYQNLKRIDVPIACSQTVADAVSMKVKRRIAFIRNGIEIMEYQPSNDRKGPIFVFCGFLSKRKNVGFLIDAFRKVKRQDVQLWIVGTGKEQKMLENLAQGDSRIVFMGYTDCPAQYLNRADYIVSASLSEGFPMAIMEGLSLGLKAILSNIDSHRELKQCCFEVVDLFGLDDVSCLVHQIEDASVHPVTDKQQRKVRIFVDASRMASEYALSYQKCVKKGMISSRHIF